MTDPETYNLSNDQVAYGYIGAEWLFEHIGGEGRVWYTRGIAGHPADTDRHEGVLQALEEYPDIELVPTEEGVHTNWDPTTATNLANEIIASGLTTTTSPASGRPAWTRRSSTRSRRPASRSCRSSALTCGRSWSSCSTSSGNYEGLEGIAVYNPAAVGGAGVTLALQVLNGEEVATTEGNTVFLPEPEAYDNVSEEGKAGLAEINVPELDPLCPVSWYIDGWTDYTFDR